MAISLYSTAELIGVIRELEPINTYWLDLCFPEVHTSETEEILFDKIAPGRKMAPFVSPMAQGKVIGSLGYETKVFTPAYVKPMHVVNPRRVIKRRAGEPLLGGMTMQQRYNAVVGDILSEHNEMHIRRREWMAAQAVINGSVVISGEEYETQNVDFGRDAANEVTLVGGAQWDQSTSTPLKDLETWSKIVRQKAKAPVRRWTMGLDAWEMFSAHEDVTKRLDYRRGTDNTLYIDPKGGEVAEYRGNIGAFEIYTYSETYEDEDGNVQEMLDPKAVIGTCSGNVIQGVRCFGAIMDEDAEFQTMEIFPKMWKQPNPSATYIMSQSAPLMVPRQINASFKGIVKT